MSASSNYVRYTDSVEDVSADENTTVDDIIATMISESRKVADRDGRTVRASHAKSTSLVKGTVEVLVNLPPQLRQGLFAEPRSYPVLMRFAQGPGEVLSDSVSTHRGIGLKVLGVDGAKLPGHTAASQDFVFATGPAFAQSTAKTFLTAIKGIEKGVGMPEGVKQAVSSTARAANAALNAVGGDSATFGFFGHTKRNPLADAYFSQAALRYGDYVAKMGVFPVSPDLVALIDQTVDTGADPDAFRHAAVDHLRSHGATFEFRVQLCTDLTAMPVEDAAVVWPEDQSPYVAVARIDIPAQDAYSPARQAFFDNALSFQPAHSLAAHRPLGSLMRARLATYQALVAYRQGQNHEQQVEPTELSQIPD